MKKNTEKKTVAEIITQRFIDALEADTIPWVKPWTHWTSWSRNTGNDYQGANLLTLSGGEYVTFKQAKEEGIQITKGAKSEMIVKYTDYKKTIKKEDLQKPENLFRWKPEEIEDLGNGKVKVPARSIKYYNVFNVEECTDAENKHQHDNAKHEWDAIEKAEEITAAFIEKSGLEVKTASNQPCYHPAGHYIETGRKEQYTNAAEYYSTMFHEMIHSTIKAMGRPKAAKKGDKTYAREELVAEIGAAYIMSYLGIESDFTEANSTAYVQNWSQALKNDPNAILWAAPKAIDAAKEILKAAGITPEA